MSILEFVLVIFIHFSKRLIVFFVWTDWNNTPDTRGAWVAFGFKMVAGVNGL